MDNILFFKIIILTYKTIKHYTFMILLSHYLYTKKAPAISDWSFRCHIGGADETRTPDLWRDICAEIHISMWFQAIRTRSKRLKVMKKPSAFFIYLVFFMGVKMSMWNVKFRNTMYLIF